MKQTNPQKSNMDWEKQEIYRLMDSFLVETDIPRTIERLNLDRHLFVENMLKVFAQSRHSQESEMEWEKKIKLNGHNWLNEDKLIPFIRQLLSQSRQQFAEEIEEHLITRLAELRFSGLEDMIDNLSVEIKEIIQANLTK